MKRLISWRLLYSKELQLPRGSGLIERSLRGREEETWLSVGSYQPLDPSSLRLSPPLLSAGIKDLKTITWRFWDRILCISATLRETEPLSLSPSSMLAIFPRKLTAHAQKKCCVSKQTWNILRTFAEINRNILRTYTEVNLEYPKSIYESKLRVSWVGVAAHAYSHVYKYEVSIEFWLFFLITFFLLGSILMVC